MSTTFGPYPATVVRVHDGDTINLDIDLGFGVHLSNQSCRVYGINAPELTTDAGKAARDFAKLTLPFGTAVFVTSHGWDKYGGRFDGSISYGGADFAQLMIDTGHAVPMVM